MNNPYVLTLVILAYISVPLFIIFSKKKPFQPGKPSLPKSNLIPPAPKPPSLPVDSIKYEFMKQDQWDVMLKTWDKEAYKGIFAQNDSISHVDQLQRLVIERQRWFKVWGTAIDKMFHTANMEDYAYHQNLAHVAKSHMNKLDNNIQYLTSYQSHVNRTVGNYEQNITKG